MGRYLPLEARSTALLDANRSSCPSRVISRMAELIPVLPPDLIFALPVAYNVCD